MKILITGATGNLGSVLTQRANMAGYSIRVLSRHTRLDSVNPDIDWAQADLENGDWVSEAVAGCDAILHLASNPKKGTRVDVDGTRNLVRAAKEHGVGHLIYMSIVGIYDIPLDYYGRKLQAEEIIQSSGVPFSILRATQFHSLIDTMLASAYRFPLFMPLPKDIKFQPVAESEVAERLLRCLADGPGGRVVDFGGPRIMTLGEMAKDWMRPKQNQKKVLNLSLPGKVIAALREGKNTTPEGDHGEISWNDWLIHRRYENIFSGEPVLR